MWRRCSFRWCSYGHEGGDHSDDVVAAKRGEQFDLSFCSSQGIRSRRTQIDDLHDKGLSASVDELDCLLPPAFEICQVRYTKERPCFVLRRHNSPFSIEIDWASAGLAVIRAVKAGPN